MQDSRSAAEVAHSNVNAVQGRARLGRADRADMPMAWDAKQTHI